MSFEHVSFAYDGVTAVFKDINLCCRPGTITALIGPSDAGKSTLISLGAAFYNPMSGRIRVDGYNVSTLRLDSYRSRPGLCCRKTFLF
ncbi:MAG TPA: ATP-binding cassette domain-containing protein [Candidatus Angelobacter sp.]|nr:ATP-binding cassette domain-containing protein [Candidatus Angelobacter sp.]